MRFIKSIDKEAILKKDYSKKVLLSLEDMAKYPGHVVQTVTIPPHTKQRNHFHMQQTEIAYVLSGNATYTVNNRPHNTTVGDIIVDEPNEAHFIHNESDEDFVVLVFKINMPSGTDDTTWLEE